MIDLQTRRTINAAAKSFASYLVRHPMLASLMSQTMTKWKIPVTDETQSLMLEETAHKLNSMVNGQ